MVETIPKINKKQIDALIYIDYFSDLGKPKPLKLIEIHIKIH